jgi:DNA-binding NarL/FixJ family response regulator
VSAPARIRVLLADDHPVVLEGIKAVLKSTAPDILVTGEARDGARALALARSTSPDVCVFDISMPVLNGLEAMTRLLAERSGARVIILSMHDDRPTVEKALISGAMGYLVKETAAEEVARALRTVHGGERYVSQSLAAALSLAAQRTRKPGPVRASLLTARERELVRLIVEGLRYAQIAARLRISESTVRTHRRNLFRKLDIHKQTDIVRYAIREGLSKP